MNVKVKEFILTNKNNGVKWMINGQKFTNSDLIPNSFLEKYVSNWRVNQWEGIIEIITEYK